MNGTLIGTLVAPPLCLIGLGSGTASQLYVSNHSNCSSWTLISILYFQVGLQTVTIRPRPNPTQDSGSLSLNGQTPQVFIADLGQNNSSSVVSLTALVFTSQSDQEAGSSSLPEQVSGRCKSLSALPVCDTLSVTPSGLSGSVSSPFPAGVNVHKNHSSKETR